MKQVSLIFFLLLYFTAASSQTAKDYTQKGRELYEKREFMEALLNLNKASRSMKTILKPTLTGERRNSFFRLMKMP